MVEMEGESRSGREETREAESSSRGKGISNPSSLPRRNARRKRSRSKSVDNDRRSEAESSSRGRGISNPSPSSRRNFQRSEAESSSRGRSISNRSSLPRRNDRRSRSVENDRSVENERRSRSVDNDGSVDNDRRRSRSGSRDNDWRRRNGTLDNDRRRSNRSSNSLDGTIISSNQPSLDGSIIGSNQHNDDIDVSSRRRRTARMSVPQWGNINPSSNPATVTQRSYIISDNTTLEVIRSRRRRRELFFSTLEQAQLLTMIPDDRRRRRELFFSTLEQAQLLMMIPDDQPIRPADRDAVQQMPRVVVSDLNNNDDNSTCSICLEKYQVGEEARLMECGHMYHKTCIFEWLENQHTCPLCRFEMP